MLIDIGNKRVTQDADYTAENLVIDFSVPISGG